MSWWGDTTPGAVAVVGHSGRRGCALQCMHQPYLWITVKRSSVVRDVVNTSSSSSTMDSAVLSLAKLFSSVLASAELPVGRRRQQ